MAYNGRSGASQDPLEKYRQALRRQSTGLGSRDLAEEPPAPVEPPAPEALDELDELLDLGEPLAVEEPLDLDEPLAPEEPLELGEPLAAEETPAPDKPRSAADWLGLDEMLGEEDPLGLDQMLAEEDQLGLEDPPALDAAPQAASDLDQDDAAIDEDLPDELQDTLARYHKAMSKLRTERAAAAPDPLAVPQAEPGGPPEGPGPATDDGHEILSKFQRAVSRQQDRGGGASEPERSPSVSRETLNQFRKARTARSEAPAVEEPAPDVPTRVRAAPKVRLRARPAPRAESGWSTRAVTFAVLLFAAPPVQWLVYKHLGVAFALEDLGAGLSALLPAALILLLARPVSGKGRFVMVVGSAAVALIGSAGFAYGLSVLQNQLPQGTSLIFGLLLSLGLFTAVWGPLFLILVPVLSRMSLPARGNP
jgi:hypothetical protein